MVRSRVIVPIIEIAVFIELGGYLGLWPTIGTVILTAAIGSALLRLQGFSILARVTESLNEGRLPMAEVFDGLCVLVAGALLLTPGFVTDGIGFLGLVAVLVMILFSIIALFVDHFVVPIMAADQCDFTPGVGKFIAVFRKFPGDFLIYLLVMIGLGILTVIINFFLAFFCIILLIFLGAVVFGALYFLVGVALKAQLAFAVLAIVLGVPSFILMLIILFSLQLPFAVFFRSLSLYYFSSLDCGYSPLPLQDAPRIIAERTDYQT